MGRVLTSIVVAACLASALPSCQKKDDGSDPSGGETLPPLSLKDETPDLLFTWIDERGAAHTAVSIAEIPAAARNPVRVVTKDAGHGQVFYVADLTSKQLDGSYSVRTMPRSEWDSLIEARRKKSRPGPPAAPSVPSTRGSAPEPPPPEPPPQTKGTIRAIVYGASWCGPCHQAKEHLERRGVAVTMYDVEREPSRGIEMRRKLKEAGRGGGSIPVIDVGGQILVGFNPSALDRAIAKAQKESGTVL
jgi:glutaredoxin